MMENQPVFFRTLPHECEACFKRWASGLRVERETIGSYMNVTIRRNVLTLLLHNFGMRLLAQKEFKVGIRTGLVMDESSDNGVSRVKEDA